MGRDSEDEYVEIDLDSAKPQERKVLVRPFVLKSFEKKKASGNTKPPITKVRTDWS